MTTVLRESGDQNQIAFIEIGSGFGGLAEKLVSRNVFEKLILLDIPHNLMTAYYYLGRCLGQGSVFMVTTQSELKQAYADKEIKIVLCPSCFCESLKELSGSFVFGNFGSFSEMDFETVSFYLNSLPSGTLGIVQINSNTRAMNTGNHKEVPCDEFPIPKDFLRVYGGQVTGRGTGDRYKATVHLRKTWR